MIAQLCPGLGMYNVSYKVLYEEISGRLNLQIYISAVGGLIIVISFVIYLLAIVCLIVKVCSKNAKQE